MSNYDAGGPEGNGSRSPREKGPTLIRIVRAFKRCCRRQSAGTELDHTENERMMARWTRGVGIFTLALAITGVIGNYIIWRQLGEMRSGGIDTHNLALAASNQADAMSDAASAMSDQADATGRLRDAAEGEATAMRRLQLAGEAQARAAYAQAISTKALADGASDQLAAIQSTAAASKTQANASRDMAIATVASSKATDRLAKSGASQVEALISSYRPWAGTSLPQSPPPTAGNEWIISIPISNFGHAPAFRAAARYVALLTDYGNQDVPPLLSECTVPECVVNTIFPGGGTGFNYKVPKELVTELYLKDIKEKKRFLVIRTRIDYSDQVGQRHWSSGCYYYIADLGFTNCPIGNEAQ